jgi:hypothetical protein
VTPAPSDHNRPVGDDGDRLPADAPEPAGPPPADAPEPADPPPADAPEPAGPPPVSVTPQPPPTSLGPWPAPGPIATVPQPSAVRARRPGRTLGVGAAGVLVIALLGAPLGLLWRAAAPQVPVVKTEDGAVLAQPQPEQFIAADGWFSLLGLGFGVLVAVAAWVILRRYRGPVALVVVVIGALGAAVLAWRLGRVIGLDEYRHLLASAPPGEDFNKPPDLRAGRFEWLYGVVPTLQGDLLVPAFGAAVSYTLLAGWSRHPTLQPEPEPAALSWGSPAPQTPPAAPAPPAPGAAEPPHD